MRLNHLLGIRLLALSFTSVAAPLAAQSSARQDVLTGRVTDFGGRPVADAQVGVTSMGSGLTRTNTTNDEGRYRIVFPENAKQYVLLVKRVGFSPVQRTITRRSDGDEQIRTDLQFGGTPLALSTVEISSDAIAPPHNEKSGRVEATVPNPVADILAMKDTLHLSAVQIVALGDLSDTLQTNNATIYHNIRVLLAKSAEAGDVNQMAGSVAMMLEEAARNTERAMTEAEKLLRPEQWLLLPPGLRDRPAPATASSGAARQ